MTPSKAEPAQNYYFFLIAGKLMFMTEENGEVTPGQVETNAIVRTESQNFGVQQLRQAQLNLHKSYMMKLPEEVRSTINVVDCVITTVQQLAYMTPEDFYRLDTPKDPEDLPGAPAKVASAPEVF